MEGRDSSSVVGAGATSGGGWGCMVCATNFFSSSGMTAGRFTTGAAFFTASCAGPRTMCATGFGGALCGTGKYVMWLV
ncbi:hypothetical protein EKK58_00200 [Candidatus Dependentiae bacterium]|nr:MAG: hypothetical protein EKK58_00200 [Candidatus Dependentiae bacterium]